jgi:short-subunit dehydrogenase
MALHGAAPAKLSRRDGSMNLGGRSVLLTGATGGIGGVVARALAARGATVILSGRRAERLEALAAELGGRAIAADLTEPGAPEALLAEAGDVDVLVANAALPASGELTSFSPAEIDRAIAVNLRAPIMLARLLAPTLIARGSGQLVFVSSLAGKAATPHASLYSATKFGLRGFSLGLRQDLAEHGVGVSCVFPGFIRDAGMFADSGAKLPVAVGTSSPDEVAAGIIRAIERNRAEVDVAPLQMKAGARLSGLAPALTANLQGRLGSFKIARSIGAGQRDKR